MQRNKRIITFVMLCSLVLSMMIPTYAFAAETVDVDQTCKLTIRYFYTTDPVAGAQFHVYRVGNVTADGSVALTSGFSQYPVNLGLLTAEGFSEAAELLYSYALLDGLAPDMTVTVGADGEVTQELPVGLYLIAGQQLSNEFGIFRTRPMLVALPTRLNQDEAWIYNLTVEPKCQYLPRERIGVMNRSVMKVWDDSDENARPQSVTVHLLRDGQVVDTVILNDENRWIHEWQNMSEEYEWRVVEEPVEGYTVTDRKSVV